MKSRLFALVAAATLALAGVSLASDDGPSVENPGENQDAPAPGVVPHTDEHAAGHGDHHVPHFSDINWFYGMFGEREGVEPSLAFRPKGMPAPFGAYLVNALILYAILYRFAKKPVSEGLKNRKAGILRGMDEAARMKKDAEARLADYESKLERIDQEIERVRREMREAGETERVRILAEARARRERMERDARLLIEQEFAATRELLTDELVRAAIRSATDALKVQANAGEQQRLADEYLAGLSKAGASLRGRV